MAAAQSRCQTLSGCPSHSLVVLVLSCLTLVEGVLRQDPTAGSDTYARMLSVERDHPSKGAGLTISATTWGPHGCISLSKSSLGTCVISTACGSADTSKVEFSFVCFNNRSSTPHALHSFGTGGFDAEEVFDSGVPCESCTSVEFAKRTGGAPVENSITESMEGLDNLARAPAPSKEGLEGLARAPAPGGDGLAKRVTTGRYLRGHGVEDSESKAPSKGGAAFFGPSACISTYLSPRNTCLIQTRCRGVDLSNFAVGVTCLDQTGDYTRYIFGKNGFDPEEIFDTTIECQGCIGVGDKPSFQLREFLPKTFVEDLSSLKAELKTLRHEVKMMKKGDQHDSLQGSDHQASTLAPAPSPVPTPPPHVAANVTVNATKNVTANATVNAAENATAGRATTMESNGAKVEPNATTAESNATTAESDGTQKQAHSNAEKHTLLGQYRPKPQLRDLLRRLVQ